MITPWYSERLHAVDRFDKLMGQVIGGLPLDELVWSPNIDVKESDDRFTFYAELPGTSIEDVQVVVEGHILSIAGSRRSHPTEAGEAMVRRECTVGRFGRTFALDSDVAADRITASFKDGILEVTVPKTTVKAAKKVAVKPG